MPWESLFEVRCLKHNPFLVWGCLRPIAPIPGFKVLFGVLQRQTVGFKEHQSVLWHNDVNENM